VCSEEETGRGTGGTGGDDGVDEIGESSTGGTTGSSATRFCGIGRGAAGANREGEKDGITEEDGDACLGGSIVGVVGRATAACCCGALPRTDGSGLITLPAGFAMGGD